jgi:hypothetical protein
MLKVINITTSKLMKSKLKINRLKTTNTMNNTPGKLRRNTVLIGAAFAGVLLAAQPARAGDIFVIAMENHNFTQPNPTSNPQQILGNPAAPFLNSLSTPGNSNAVQVSYATRYFNSGNGVHPSEPNYVWAEAGTDFGFHSDADPTPANGNTFYDHSIHLTAQLDAAGYSWKNYQEDVQLSSSPTNSASGTNAPVLNPFYGTAQYNYAVKHNPMAFFADTAVKNVFPLVQLFQDLASHTTGSYNWITPNQFDDAHSALNGGFTYQGTHYTGDQASIAQGDNFLATVIPEIMASKAYQENGAIIIWWDESEGGDTAGFTIPEIIISPLAKGNAYASAVTLSHSSDIKTMAEIFRLPAINNPIPLGETNVDGGYNNVAIVNDLSDLFVPVAIPVSPSLTVTPGHLDVDHHQGRASQQVEIKNTGATPVAAPLFLVLDNLSSNATLVNSGGLTTTILAPLGSPYVSVSLNDHDGNGDADADDNVLLPHQSKKVTLEFLDPSGDTITYNTRVLSVTPTP